MKSTRRRTFVLILLPVIFFVWIIGWTMYCIGDRSTATRVLRKQKDDVQTVVTLETPEITEQVIQGN